MSKKVQDHDTIAAVATPPGRGAIGIVRISGPEAVAIASRLFRGRAGLGELRDWSMTLGRIERDGEIIDEVICLTMRGPRSYTREDVVEFHCHGGRVPLAGVLSAVIGEGARPAEPGEFTRRAFLAGRIDLAQAEAVADLIESETGQAARAAMGQLAGGLSRRLEVPRDQLMEVMALFEATMDFSDEEDVITVEAGDVLARLGAIESALASLLKDAGLGRRLREGARVVIAGRPNVGKSTLMNTLLHSDRVIVDPEPGTTRDVVEDVIEIAGMPVRIFDTAGIRDDAGKVERIGVDRARAAAASSDLVIFMIDGSVPLSGQDRGLAESIEAPMIVAANKCDLEVVVDEEEAASLARSPAVRISALTGQGVPELEKAVAENLMGGPASAETPLITNARHEGVLVAARASLLEAMDATRQGMSLEFIASDLKRALAALGEITGETTPDDILELIFSRFCMGK